MVASAYCLQGKNNTKLGDSYSDRLHLPTVCKVKTTL